MILGPLASKPSLLILSQDVKSLIEQLRGIEREYLMLDDSKKEVTDLDSQLDNTVIHSEELQEKQKVETFLRSVVTLTRIPES